MALIMVLIAGMLAFSLTATLIMVLWQAGARFVRYLKAQRRVRREAIEPR
jgi:hypothetical protein